MIQKVTASGNEWERVTAVVQRMKIARYTLKNEWFLKNLLYLNLLYLNLLYLIYYTSLCFEIFEKVKVISLYWFAAYVQATTIWLVLHKI